MAAERARHQRAAGGPTCKMATTARTLNELPPRSRNLRVYLVALAGSCSAVALLIALTASWLSYDGGTAHDFISQIARDGDANWYRNFGGRSVPQIQDQDIFYSNIGSSVASVKNADIVFLGPSFVSYAIDRQTLQSSPELDRLKIYNLAFVGLRGGEFSRRIIERWKIRAPLWVINVDDQFVHFFSDDLNVTLGPQKVPIAAVQRDRIRGFMTVVGRNLRWRVEDAIAALETGHFSPIGIYRNVANGDMALDVNPAYLAAGNGPMRLARDPDCHTNADIVAYGKRFLSEIGGRAVLMLVPHSQACVQQARELADALGVEFIAPSFDGLTTVDGGGHLDRNGAQRFTRELAAQLIKTNAFRQAVRARPAM
ncbi:MULTISPECIES: hypothetical protein [unclassified Bradyrhizobium]|uniref:hypothetical protein n=1 Tax=unclassified Bradyrhizobium TaxID=2631580 RepID=UPI0028E35DB4|nr:MULTISPECIES: hypothetical protein [unclassified Bradyrhizobium]